MPEEHTSPEEKLLKLIRGDKKSREKPPAEIPAVGAEPAIAKGSRDRLKLVNITLVVILAIIAAVLLLDTVTFNLRKERVAGSATVGVDRLPAEKIPQSERSDTPSNPQQENMGLIEARDLFKPQIAAPQSSGMNEGVFDRLKDLSLKGIIAGDNPQAIIEDTKNQKSYFLNKGQSINRMMVEDILEDRVILKVDGEVFELTL